MWRYDQDGSIGQLPLGKGVVHVAIATCEDVAETKLCEGMTVFWRGDRPIGHVLVHEGETTNCKVGHIDETFPAAIDVDMQTRAEIKLSASVVICTRDRPDELSIAFPSLPRQSYPPREIIVVDNASRDQRTRNVALAAGVTYVREDRPGLALLVILAPSARPAIS